MHQTTADLLFAAPDLLVGHHQFGHPQVVFFTQVQQLCRAGEIVRQLGAIHIDHSAAGLRLIDDKTAADRIVGIAM
ncbi:hypothetical protein D3C80_2080500 [compost metagenome]